MKSIPAIQSEVTQALAPQFDAFVRYGEVFGQRPAISSDITGLVIRCEGNAEYAIHTQSASLGIRQHVDRFVMPGSNVRDFLGASSLLVAKTDTNEEGLFLFRPGVHGMELQNADDPTATLLPSEALTVTGVDSAASLARQLAEQVRGNALGRGWRSRSMEIDHDARVVVSEYEILRGGGWVRGRSLSMQPRSREANFILRLNMLNGTPANTSELVEVEEFMDMRSTGDAREDQTLSAARLAEVESYLGSLLERLAPFANF